MTATTSGLSSKIVTPIVFVSALGYLVDVYDNLIFNVTRVQSITDLGLSGDALTNAGLFILNMQMAGFLLGGIAFGIAGDRLGRKSCLLASILLYSLATLGCAFVDTIPHYAFLRFIAGLGLAGEIGIGVTLITESMARDKRSIGTALFATIGISGAVIAAVMAEFIGWRDCYLIGGIAGLVLLVTRSFINESGMFLRLKEMAGVHRGRIGTLLADRVLRRKYIACVAAGAPIYFFLGIMWTLAPELSRDLGVVGIVKGNWALGLGQFGIMTGDLAAGLLSHYCRSRLKPMLWFMTSCAILFAGLFYMHGMSAHAFYAFCLLSGLSTGYWVNMITTAAEQFGTNLRATAATSIPNFVRATLLPMNFALAALKTQLGISMAALIIGGVVLVLALLALTRIEETYGKDLDYRH